ncbi:hypothetical protein QTP70_034431 [Hemibagrus guttatus]|uniref:Uncharacterized protein n=1 Tax=Hemibagrus guttatus TaxID=175788 RepID=A0AAE0QIS2_9TELE|nr:hypothetical protein QTP70_034431 [Hemibagrus guttatus]
MERLIHQDQTYCVPDRSIFDNVYLIRDILDVSRLLGLKTGLIFLDQEKRVLTGLSMNICGRAREGQTEQVEAAGPEDVLQGGERWLSTTSPRRPPWHKLACVGAFSTCRKRKEGRGWASYLAEPQPSDSSSSRDSSLDPRGPIHWLLEEPLVYGGRLDISGVTVPRTVQNTRLLGHCDAPGARERRGVRLVKRGEDLAARMGLRSRRVVNQLLHRWRSALTSEERFSADGLSTYRDWSCRGRETFPPG